MDQEDWQHESRQGELPIEPRMGQVLTYWRPLPEVSPDEDFRREVDNKVCYFGCLESNLNAIISETVQDRAHVTIYH